VLVLNIIHPHCSIETPVTPLHSSFLVGSFSNRSPSVNRNNRDAVFVHIIKDIFLHHQITDKSVNHFNDYCMDTMSIYKEYVHKIDMTMSLILAQNLNQLELQKNFKSGSLFQVRILLSGRLIRNRTLVSFV